MDWAKSDKGKAYFTNLLNNPKAYCLIAEIDGKKVGYLAAEPKNIDYLKSRYIEIETIGVDPKYRSKGIGSKLVQAFLKWAKEEGYQKAYVNPYSRNVKAIEFYKDNGFGEIDVSLEKNL